MKNMLARFVKQSDGQDLIEYALLAALIAVVLTGAMTTLAGKISDEFVAIGGKL